MAVYSMKKNIIPTLHHCVKAENEEKQHSFCPPSENSLYKWQQDLATGASFADNDNDCLPEIFLQLL